MEAEIIFKFFIFALLITILISLSAGMFFIVKDKGQGERTLTSLKFRISLSVLLFLSLLVGHKLGWITPHNIYQPVVPPSQIEKAP